MEIGSHIGYAGYTEKTATEDTAVGQAESQWGRLASYIQM